MSVHFFLFANLCVMAALTFRSGVFVFHFVFSNDSELKTAEKEAQFKGQQQEQRGSKDTAAQSALGDEKTLEVKCAHFIALTATKNS